MIENILYAVFAIFGLGFLVFIHELGHYIVAKKQGMRIEVFAIGFGKPIYSWMFQNVKWQIGILPFGGYVKIAGMQKEKGVEPADIPDGFFGKTPWQRIKVAFAGPFVNIAFSLMVFVGLWLFGGRDKNFSEFTHHIGWVDPKSALYDQGVRPGDLIQKYSGRDFGGFKDLLMSSVMNEKTTRIEGYKFDYITNHKKPFDYTLTTYAAPDSKEKMSTIGVLTPAQYLIYDQERSAQSSKLAGLLPLDRFIRVDGEIVFSQEQLRSLVNDSTAFFTIRRGDQIFHAKVPRVHLDELTMSGIEKAEISDWQYEAGLKTKFQDLYFIPYNLSPSAQIEGRLSFIDDTDQRRAFEYCERCPHFHPLQEGDQILAIDGMPIKTSYELLDLLQTRRVLAIVARDPSIQKSVLWTDSDAQFENFNYSDLSQIVASIGTRNAIHSSGDLVLLNPMIPKPRGSLVLNSKLQEQQARDLAHYKKQIDRMQDPKVRSDALNELDKSQKALVLGLAFKDRGVRYNPTPLDQFSSVFGDTWRTLSGLVSGSMNAKFVSGPIGIVHVVHQSWKIGIHEALFWMAVISLNLGIMNLLPIPVLDGGHIMLSAYEMVTRRRLSAKVMERLIVPFVGLMIGLFIYVTYQDLARLFSKFF
ncbi:MAG TPA: site-2 protease family protein [Chlamydiales bacterium]|nr:site-2 protease family protein [Chlamydiales bacterium]